MTDILIVEDNEELGALIRDFLVRDGFTVTWKTTGEAGLSALKEDKYRLMLLDVMLPGFDGYETLRILRPSGHHDECQKRRPEQDPRS